jgi:hypothetical protein
LTERAVRRLSRADGSSCCVGFALDELSENMKISFSVALSGRSQQAHRPMEAKGLEDWRLAARGYRSSAGSWSAGLPPMQAQCALENLFLLLRPSVRASGWVGSAPLAICERGGFITTRFGRTAWSTYFGREPSKLFG